MQAVDYIIVGQGIAGSILAWQLIQRGKKVLVIDKEGGETSSLKAAGLINPLTGRRFVKSWMIEDLLPAAHEMYREIEKAFSVQILAQIEGQRIIKNTEQLNDVDAKLQLPSYQHYLPTPVAPIKEQCIQNPLGSIMINHVAKIDVALLLSTLKEYFLQKGVLLNQTFDYDAVELSSNEVIYKDHVANGVIFCSGYQENANPYFNYLPLRPVKGEAIIVNISELKSEAMINGPVNITPWKEDDYYIGSTYDWDNIDFNPTKDKRDQLEEKLKSMVDATIEVKNQIVGMRPTTLDRRPFVGQHPTHQQLFIFNGLGTKGLSLAPYFSKQLADFIEHKTPIHKEADIRRFAKYYES